METKHYDTLSPFFKDQSMMRFNLPHIVTLYNEVFIGQELFLVHGSNNMKIVEVVEVCESDGFVNLTVQDQNTGEIIELSSSLDHSLEDAITWMVISVAYLIELVILRMKQGFK